MHAADWDANCLATRSPKHLQEPSVNPKYRTGVVPEHYRCALYIPHPTPLKMKKIKEEEALGVDVVWINSIWSQENLR